MSNRQATKRNGAQKKAPKRQNNSSNAGQARAKQANARANRGVGPYIAAPLNAGRQMTSMNPGISMAKDGTHCRVVQRELIDVLSSSAPGFQQLKRFRCNPGSSLCFPWLSTMANSWETYRFNRLSFESVPRCSTTTNGSVLISPDYDAQDGAPTTETQMSQMKGTKEGPPWQHIVLQLDPKAMNRLYKAHVTMDDSRFATTTQDEKTIDVAQVFFGNDLDGSIAISKIWVNYDVELFTPQPPNLPLPYGGGSITLGTSSSNPNANGAKFSNTLDNTEVLQDVKNPLFTVIDNTVPSSNLIKFNRDWQGNVDWLVNYGNAGGTFNAGPTLFKNGVALAHGGVSADSFFRNFINGNGNSPGTLTTGTIYESLKFLAGDVLGIDPNGIQGVTGTLAGIDSVLRLGGNLFPFV